nr:phospholipase D3-like [Onthophagus taurus]
MPKIWDYLGKNSPKHRNLQDGLFQIASQTCNLLVQVNNTNNISFGDNTTNILSNTLDSRFQKYKSTREESDQVVVLIPPDKPSGRIGRSKSFGGGILKPKLSTVLETSPLGNEEEGELWNHGFTLPANNNDGSPIRRISGRKGWCKPSCIPISIILLLIFLVVLLPLLDHGTEKQQINTTPISKDKCLQECSISLTETIPFGMTFEHNQKLYSSTHETWLNLINSADDSIKILSTHWALKQKDKYPDPSSIHGEEIFASLLQATQEKSITIKIIQNIPSRNQPNTDTDYLLKKKVASVRNLNFPQILGRGKSNSKLWIIDDVHFYLGSANLDWRSLTQTKELGLVGYNCSCIVEDLNKIFQLFWMMGEKDFRLPDQFPSYLNTKFNGTNPINVDNYEIFIATSPDEFLPPGREKDLDTILNLIQKTENFIYISIMDYLPLSIFSPTTKYWPILDDALKKSAIDHHVHIKMLVGSFNQTWFAQEYFLKALEDISHSDPKVDIEVRRFIISGTSNQLKIENARVSNGNFMVTESSVYVGTSGWTGDYFMDMSSIGFVLLENSKNNRSLREDLVELFERDWNSKYSFPLDVLR